MSSTLDEALEIIGLQTPIIDQEGDEVLDLAQLLQDSSAVNEKLVQSNKALTNGLQKLWDQHTLLNASYNDALAEIAELKARLTDAQK